MYYLLATNLLLSIVAYLIYDKKSRAEAIFAMAMVICLPLLGITVLASTALCDLFVVNKNDFTNVGHSNNHPDIYQYNKTESALKDLLVPLDDAYILGDIPYRRQLVINAIKDDAMKYVRLLSYAVKDADTEISHYGAAAITEAIRRCSTRLGQVDKLLQNMNQGEDILEECLQTIDNCLSYNIMDNKTNQKFKRLKSQILTKLLRANPNNESYHILKIQNDIELELFDNAKKHCEMFYNEHSNSIWPFITYLKLYYAIRDGKNFYKTLQALMDKNYANSDYAAGLVEFWSAGCIDYDDNWYAETANQRVYF